MQANKKPKIFLIDISSSIMVEVALKLMENSFDIAYWTGRNKVFNDMSKNKEKFPKTIFHSFYDAAQGKPAKEIDCSKFEPIGKELIQEMLECESITLSMLTRMDWSNIPFLKKKHLYYKYLWYWDGLIKTLKPDMIIFRSIPHAGYNYVVYCLAKKYNIKTIMFETFVMEDRLMIIRDYKKSFEDVRDIYNKIKNEKHSVDELEHGNQLILKKLVNLKNDITQDYVKKQVSKAKTGIKSIPSIKKIIKNIKSGNFIPVCKYHIKSLLGLTSKVIHTIDEDDKTDYRNIYQLKKIKKIKEKYKKEYFSLQSEPDFNKKYIYFPLHYQPECNTSPMADHFADQILMIKILSSAIPSDWKIYVKENILQWNDYNPQPHLYRYNGYYKEIASLKNVSLISPLIQSKNLIDSSMAVSTATGTAGLEAVARGKPALIFGYSWYMYCDGVFKISNIKTCKDVLEKIINGYKPNPQKVLNYFIAMEKSSIKGNHLEYRQRVNNFSIKESVKNITNSIIDEIKLINNK
ncbi:MAG: hypothetical protein ABIA02_04140 [Candidatus Falkowbacteria bacterium]